MDEVTLALDWTPNTNHTGFFAALAEGEFADRDLEVDVRSPAVDDYEQTPAKLLATGAVDLAIAPSESVISYHTHPDYPSLTAVAAVCQRDTSAIATLSDSGIDRPRDIDGHTYASYDARFEDDIVRKMVRNDGGDGEFEVVTPPKLGIPNTLVDGSADATWVFLPWEGLAAERDGIDLNAFRMDEYDVPYGYTPTLLARPDELEAGWLERFLAAATAGHDLAATDPERGADLLAETATGLDRDPEFLRESQRRVAPALREDGRWGYMARERWAAFVDWLTEAEILTDLDDEPIPREAVDVDATFSNAALP
jgi:NitT/TauT family transport system substrate-binding protein